MTVRRPLVNDAGTIKELPVGDSMPSNYLSVLNRLGSQVLISLALGYLPVLNRSGATIQVPVS